VRTNEYKLIDNFLDEDIDELYDLINDPGEMKNLINDTNFDSIENKLRKEAEKLKEQYNYNPDRDWWLRKQIRK
jgi:arylsulfatase A-like enzyme